MVPEIEKPRVTEIRVRIDCNGCVQKIKKALYGINGIYDLYIDIPQQKITIIGWADPEKIIKAIKKTRKTATICYHSEPSSDQQQQSQPQPQPEQGPPPPPDSANNPPQPPQDQPPPPPPENQPSSVPVDCPGGQPGQPSGPEAQEVQVVSHHPPDQGHANHYGHPNDPHLQQGSQCPPPQGPPPQEPPPQGPPPSDQPPPDHSQSHGNSHTYGHPNEPRFQQEQRPPVYVTHSYSTYQPSPSATHSYNRYESLPSMNHNYNAYRPSPYITEYQHTWSTSDRYSDDYRISTNSSNGNGNITSVFSDENPNACCIV